MEDRRENGAVEMGDLTRSPDYEELIIEMVHKIKDEKFKKQIYTIIRRHMKKEG